MGWILGFRGKYSYYNPSNIKNSCNSIYYKKGQSPTITPFYITKIITKSANLLISNSLYSKISNNYLLLSINDFQNNHNSSLVSLYQQSSLQDNNLIAKILDPSTPFLTSPCCFKETNCNFSSVDRIYFGPTKINRLQIKLLDMFGRIADLNNGDWSLVLEVELLYDL